MMLMQPHGDRGYGHGGSYQHGPAASYGDGYSEGGYGDSGSYAGEPVHRGAYGGTGVASPGMMSRDPQRAWDFTSLQSRLQDMQVAVVQADEALAGRDGSIVDGTGGPNDGMETASYDSLGNPIPRFHPNPSNLPQIEFDDAGQPIPPPPQIFLEDLPELAQTGGSIHKKGGKPSMLFSRSWSVFFMQLQPLDEYAYEWGLVFYDKEPHDKPSYVFRVDGHTYVIDGDPVKVHKNKNVKFDFAIANHSNEQISLYCETQEEAADWIDIVHYVVSKIQEYEHYADNPDELLHLAEQQAGSGGSIAGGASVNGSIVHKPFRRAAYPVPDSHEDIAEKQALADDAQCHNAFGPGLYEATHGEQTYFVIQANEASGVPRVDGGDYFSAALISNELEVEIVPVDNHDGTYLCEYTPSRAGEYELRVLHGDNHIYGSPFHLIVGCAPTAANHSITHGDGTSISRPGRDNVFVIVARDQFDIPRKVGGDHFELTVIGAGKAKPIMDNGDGTYTVSYTVDTEHKAYREALSSSRSAYVQLPTLEVHISLRNEAFSYARPVTGSPFRPRIVVPELEGILGGQARASIPSHFVSPTLLQSTPTAARAEPTFASPAFRSSISGVHNPYRQSQDQEQPRTAAPPAPHVVRCTGGGASARTHDLRIYKLHCYAGGPPCQSFSRYHAGKRASA
jgi:hypothetical protein